MNFDSFGLAPEISAAIAEAGYSEPTPIQAQAIPVVLEGRDVLGIAQTGTGKTAGFTLPMIHRLMKGRARARMPRTLILEPTRELAAQVAESFDTYGKNTRLTKALLIGGVAFGDQERAIDRGADVLIATPGRLLDHVERGKVMLRGVEVLVIDEADRMLDMGFIPDIERIVKLLPFTRQTLFFSATMPPEITRLSEQFLQAPERIEVAPPASTGENIKQNRISVSSDPAQKRAALRTLLRNETQGNAIIFCNRKRDVALLLKSLQNHGLSAVGLHGDMDQHTRLEMLDRFKNGEAALLVASDVAARGLDIPAVEYVFNYDVPTHAEDYVHRVGRTGRAGRTGQAYTLETPSDGKYIEAIESLIKRSIEPIKIDGIDRAGSDEARPARTDDAPRRRRRSGERGDRRSAPRHSAAREDGGGERRRRGSRGGRKRGPLARGGQETETAGNTERKSEDTPRRPAPRRDDSRRGGASDSFGDNAPAFLSRPTPESRD